MYGVELSSGQYEDHFTWIQFATEDRLLAETYAAKYDRILWKWKEYFTKWYVADLDLEVPTYLFADRYFQISDLHSANIIEIEIR